jgi:hypothetical protein
MAAPVSILICATLILNAYFQDYGREYAAPPLLNTTFKYWTLVPGTNETKPYLWETDFMKGPLDRLWLAEDTVDGEKALGLHIYQDGLDDTFDWAMLHVRQDLRGVAASKVLENNLGVWIYPTFPYHSDHVNNNPHNAFGIEVNDGIHIIWFIFAPGEAVVYELKLHRIVLIPTPLNQWSYREINIKEQYDKAGWLMPGSFSLILLTGATKVDPGFYAGYFKSVNVTQGSTLVGMVPQIAWSPISSEQPSRKE